MYPAHCREPRGSFTLIQDTFVIKAAANQYLAVPNEARYLGLDAMLAVRWEATAKQNAATPKATFNQDVYCLDSAFSHLFLSHPF